MKLPAAYSSVTLSPFDSDFSAVYPPLGFCPIAERALGNGDVYGLYWPIGHEDREPIVAEIWHDEWSVAPEFSSLEKFLSAPLEEDEEEDDDEFRRPEPVTIEHDPQSPLACLNAAREAQKTQDVDRTIALLEMAARILPEYTEAQALLATQYRRVGKMDAAIRAALQTVISPPCFGARPTQLLQWLAKQTKASDEIQNDPIWGVREKLSGKFGGVKTNDEYKVMRGAIEEYLGASAFVPAMTLMQTYGELMGGETVSFQERYDFDKKEFRAWQREVAEVRYGKSRVLTLPGE